MKSPISETYCQRNIQSVKCTVSKLVVSKTSSYRFGLGLVRFGVRIARNWTVLRSFAALHTYTT